MTRRDLTKEVEEDIPVYLDTPFLSIKDNLYFAYWGDRLVWSEFGKNPWFFDSNNKYISDQEFENQSPGYSQLTDVLADKETFTAKYI